MLLNHHNNIMLGWTAVRLGSNGFDRGRTRLRRAFDREDPPVYRRILESVQEFLGLSGAEKQGVSSVGRDVDHTVESFEHQQRFLPVLQHKPTLPICR